jgi:hypothetical protein
VEDRLILGGCERKEESSFLKKRSKKLLFLRRFLLSGHGLDLSVGARAKVFWFFSPEKNILT